MPSGILKRVQEISGNLTETKKEALKERSVVNYPELTAKSYIELLEHTSGILGQVTAPAFLGTWHYIPGNTAG